MNLTLYAYAPNGQVINFTIWNATTSTYNTTAPTGDEWEQLNITTRDWNPYTPQDEARNWIKLRACIEPYECQESAIYNFVNSSNVTTNTVNVGDAVIYINDDYLKVDVPKFYVVLFEQNGTVDFDAVNYFNISSDNDDNTDLTVEVETSVRDYFTEAANRRRRR
jgi:hypothetical protein